MGYGIRLLWPDHHDGRRRDGDLTVAVPRADPALQSRFYGLEFLNATYDDVLLSRDDGFSSLAVIARPTASTVPRSPSMHSPFQGQESHFLSYCEFVMSAF
jgi:hypothetical protein